VTNASDPLEGYMLLLLLLKSYVIMIHDKDAKRGQFSADNLRKGEFSGKAKKRRHIIK